MLLSYFEPTTYKVRGGKNIANKNNYCFSFLAKETFIDKNVMITCF